MELEIRERRRAARKLEARRRLVAAGVLVVVAHLVGAPLLILSIPVATPLPAEPEVALVRVPASQWEAARAASPGPERSEADSPSPRPVPSPPPPPPEPPPPPRQRPGQVVETAPGNDEAPPDDTALVAETNNRVEKQTLAADRKAGQKVTMPRTTTSAPPTESTRPAPPQPLAIAGDPGEEAKLPSEVQPRLEIPRVLERQKLALKLDRGEGAFRNREASEALPGNSDRLRLQTGAGESDAAAGGGRPGARELTTLVPSAGVLEQITGGPAPDHVEGVDEGGATFLNTREWRFASFFNRVKSTVAAQWDPSDVVRRRDPTGDLFLWKDRYTLLTVRLRDDGRLADVWIERSSGVDFLDEEAVVAFQKAQPFPNPPRGLADENGEIRFTFGFYLETSRPAFRIFRR